MPTEPTGIPLSLDGRTALITGGSRGIGAATVRLFRRAGARVAFSYRQAEEQAQSLSTECGGPDLCLPIRQDGEGDQRSWWRGDEVPESEVLAGSRCY